ncbi:ABC transporter ATP-binding protein [Berryella wangjianweii]
MSERDDRLELDLQLQAERRRRSGGPRRHGMGPGVLPVMPRERHDVRGALLKLGRFMGRYRFALLVALAFAIGATTFNIVGPKVLSGATTVLFEGLMAKVAGTGQVDFDAIRAILLQTLALYLVATACSYVQGWVLTSVAQRTTYNLRTSIAQKMDRLPVGYFESQSVGDVLSRITNDVDTLGQTLSQSLAEAVRSVVTVVGVLVMMFLISPALAAVTLLVLPVSGLLVGLVVKRSQGHFFAQQKLIGAIDGQIEETFAGHAVMQAFNQQDAALSRFSRDNGRLYEASWKSQFLSGLMRPILDGVGNLAYASAAILGAALASAGAITVGDIQASIQYIRSFTQPLSSLAQVGNLLQQTAAAAERVFDFLDAAEEQPESSLVSAADVEATVEFDHVTFGYDPQNPVIRGFTATVGSGQTVALVGSTGAGKTTLMKLLMRFYDVQGGAIRVGGHDLRSFDRADVRTLFGMVLQDAWLFSGTIRENIRYGRPDATDAEVEWAARQALAHHFIESLPGGYDCMVGEDAGNLSAGQRQLITIARAFLAKRRMLILDEATSSVDTRTEARIQQAMDRLMAGRTSFVIAHRLSTIRHADLILVIDEGDVVEQGTHDQLLSAGGFYADLYNSQFSLVAAQEPA